LQSIRNSDEIATWERFKQLHDKEWISDEKRLEPGVQGAKHQLGVCP
jgi:hypothetical protein